MDDNMRELMKTKPRAIALFGDDVRLVCRDGGILVLQQTDKAAADGWKDAQNWDERSDDFAYTDAHATGRALAKTLARRSRS